LGCNARRTSSTIKAKNDRRCNFVRPCFQLTWAGRPNVLRARLSISHWLSQLSDQQNYALRDFTRPPHPHLFWPPGCQLCQWVLRAILRHHVCATGLFGTLSKVVLKVERHFEAGPLRGRGGPASRVFYPLRNTHKLPWASKVLTTILQRPECFTPRIYLQH